MTGSKNQLIVKQDQNVLNQHGQREEVWNIYQRYRSKNSLWKGQGNDHEVLQNESDEAWGQR